MAARWADAEWAADCMCERVADAARETLPASTPVGYLLIGPDGSERVKDVAKAKRAFVALAQNLVREANDDGFGARVFVDKAKAWNGRDRADFGFKGRRGWVSIQAYPYWD